MSEKSHFDILWRIENFAYCLEKHEEELVSPKFILDSLFKTEWSLTLYPRGDSDKDYMDIFLDRTVDANGPGVISLRHQFSLLDADSTPLKYRSAKNNFDRSEAYAWGLHKFISRDEVIVERPKHFLPQGTLTVLCRIETVDDEPEVCGHCIARTHIGVEHRAFDWDIDGILDLPSDSDKSITVHSTENKYPSLTMKLIFQSEPFSDKTIQVQLIQVDANKSNFTVCKISVLNMEGKAVLSAKDEHFFEVETGEQVWGFPLFLRQSYLISNKSLLLRKGILSLRCEYTMSVGAVLNNIEYLSSGSPSLRMINSNIDDSYRPNCYDIYPKASKFSLKDDLRNLYKNKEMCDVKLQTGNKTFSAHKIILSSRSPVFKAMFKSDMEENTSGSVCIPDIDANTVEQMLSFMYTDTVDDLDSENASKLYFSADKYQLESLKEVCSSYLGDHLNSSNVCEVLILSDLHKDVSLKRTVEEFISLHESEIIPSNEWKNLMKSNVELAADTMHLLFMKKM